MTRLRDSVENINVTDYALSRIQDNLSAGIDACLGFINTVFSYNTKTKILTVTGASNVTVTWGAGAPSYSAGKGSMYLRTDGGAGTTLYINETGNATWRAV